MQQTIAITGASGHIGNNLCRQLLQLGYRVRAQYQQDDRALAGLPLEKIQGNMLSPDDMQHLVSGCDVVIHCAARISIHGDADGKVFTTNTDGVKNVLDASIRQGVRRILHISSTHAVHERPHESVFDELRPYKDASGYAYDFSKAVGEQVLLNSQHPGTPEIVILRPSSVIGPHDYKPSELGKALLDFYFQRIPLLPAGGYNFVDVRDVANSIVRAIDHGQHRQVYLLSGQYYSLQDFAAVVKRVTGRPVPSLTLPYWLLRGLLPAVTLYARWRKAAPVFTRDAIDALYHGHPHMDHGKATRELGHQPRSLEESIRDFFTWQQLPILPFD